ncbi:MAG TPA: sulfatase [Gemmataceae bacterium]|nr:sulfatase [Gemmataceae bacterium]
MTRWLLPLVLPLALALPAFAGPKNVVLLVADDLGMQVGCYGDPAAKTPNIDALAKSGTRFTHGFASVSSCSPSRASLLTGMPTHMSGQYGLAHADHNFHSFAKVKGLPALLGPAGVKSAVIAKLHVLPKEVYPFDAEMPGNGRNPVQVAEQARKFVADCGDKPFFLLVGFTDPHRAGKGFANDGKYPPSVPAVKFDPKTLPVPYHLPDTPEVRAELAEYYESVARMDHGVGLVLKVLEDAKKLDDTLVIFLSDNGIPFPGAKTTLYDAGVHLPLVIRRPGQKSGVVCSAMASWTDITPTILDWTGVKPPANLPGHSLLPVLEQEKPEGWDVVYGSHQFHEVTMYYPMRMIRTRTHKYILNLANILEYPHASDLWGSETWQGILKRGDKMMGQKSVDAFLHRPKEELYDLTADPNELKNLAADPAQAKLLDEMRTKLAAWRKQTNDPWLIKDQHE